MAQARLVSVFSFLLHLLCTEIETNKYNYYKECFKVHCSDTKDNAGVSMRTRLHKAQLTGPGQAATLTVQCNSPCTFGYAIRTCGLLHFCDHHD